MTAPLMARLLQHLLARLPKAANQGWVLEGWPKNLAAARVMAREAQIAVTKGPAAGCSEGSGVEIKSAGSSKKDHAAYPGKVRIVSMLTIY